MNIRNQAKSDLEIVRLLRDRDIDGLLNALVALIKREGLSVSDQSLQRLTEIVSKATNSASQTPPSV